MWRRRRLKTNWRCARRFLHSIILLRTSHFVTMHILFVKRGTQFWLAKIYHYVTWLDSYFNHIITRKNTTQNKFQFKTAIYTRTLFTLCKLRLSSNKRHKSIMQRWLDYTLCKGYLFQYSAFLDVCSIPPLDGDVSNSAVIPETLCTFTTSI